MYRIITALVFCVILFFSQGCKPSPSPHPAKACLKIANSIHAKDTSGLTFLKQKKYYGSLECRLIKLGLVNIHTLDTNIKVDLRYSTRNNFLGKDVYGDLNRAYFQPDVAEKLKIAQGFLKEKHPGYNLLVFDAVRPVSIQQMMWDTIKFSGLDKMKYFSSPQYGSLHNFGAAVDIGIMDSTQKELDMGTGFDYFGELAHPEKELELMQLGKISEQQILNRQLLRSVMYKAGFFNIQTEWWHFNSCTREKAQILYKIIE